MRRGLFLALLIAAGLLPVPAQVRLTRQDGSIAVEVDGKPFTAFYFGASAPKPFLHPLTSANGVRLTRLYPIETQQGESRDHPHHRGLWITHGDVNGFDFWANESEQRKGKQGSIVLREIKEVNGGAKQGAIRAAFEWQDPSGKPLLTEDRTMTFSGDARSRTIDFDITYRAIPQVVFGDTKEGFFALRLREELTEQKGTGRMTNAEGQCGMAQVWGKRSEWVDYAGQVDGAAAGVAIFDHPSNPAHPTWWHSRDYGLFAANPFGERDFSGDKSKNGSLTLTAGKSVRFRYRVFIHAGDTAQGNVAAAYKAWSGQ